MCSLTERLASELTGNGLSSQATLTWWNGTETSVRSHKRLSMRSSIMVTLSSNNTLALRTADHYCPLEFTFPLPTVPAVKPELAETMGARLPSPGGHSGKNLSNLSNPLFWPETLELFAMHDRLGAKVNQWTTKDRRFLDELCARNKDPMIFQSGPQSAIHHLPFNPSLKPEPVQA